MPGYQNVMEILVEQMYSSIESTLDCCACPLCKADIIAYALNQLPQERISYPGSSRAGSCGRGCSQQSSPWSRRFCCP